MRTIDVNADVGEGCGDDVALFHVVTSANIACGGHAGDAASMRATLERAKRHGVAAGAHPSYPDREGFGRREIERSPAEICGDVRGQIEALAEIARDLAISLVHVKPHGALYNRAARDPDVARAIAAAVADVDRSLAVVGLAGGAQARACAEIGLTSVAEIFADRRYRPDGTLVPRSEANAVIDDVEEAVAQTLALVRDERRAADTICVHGDTAGAVTFARSVVAALRDAGVEIAPVARSLG